MTAYYPELANEIRDGRSTPMNDASHALSFGQLVTRYDSKAQTLWTDMRPRIRPSFNPDLLRDFERWQDGIVQAVDTGALPVRYLVLGSSFPGVFSLGGDLDLFAQAIRNRDHAALARYGHRCVRILYRNMCGLERPIITIGLVEGDALGGGFEALLSFHVVIAERGTSFGLPETMFGLFPGMGAHCFLSRRLGAARAERMILSGRTYSADELYEMGLVHGLAKPGEGRKMVADYVRQNDRRHSAHCAIYEASRAVNPLRLEELEAVVDLWADAALRLTEGDLKRMERLVAAQTRLRGKSGK
jgi:DSF synthase